MFYKQYPHFAWRPGFSKFTEDVWSQIGSFSVLKSQTMALFLGFHGVYAEIISQIMMMAFLFVCVIGAMQCFYNEFASILFSEYSIRHWRNRVQFFQQSTLLVVVCPHVARRGWGWCVWRVGERGGRAGGRASERPLLNIQPSLVIIITQHCKPLSVIRF